MAFQVNETLVCGHLYDSYLAVLSCGIVYYTVHRVYELISPWMKPQCVTTQMKAIEQYVHVVLFIMLYKVVLAIKSADETLVCGHSNESN